MKFPFNSSMRTTGIAMVTLCCSQPVLPEVLYSVTDLGSFAINSIAIAINNNNQVVGFSDILMDGEDPAVDPPVTRSTAFLYENGNLFNLGDLPGGILSAALAINDDGFIVGQSNTEVVIVEADGENEAVTGQFGHAFVYTTSLGLVDLNTLDPRGFNQALAINAAGVIVGQSFTESSIDDDGDLLLGPLQAARYTPDGNGGYSFDPLRTNTSTTTLARAINNEGLIVGEEFIPASANLFGDIDRIFGFFLDETRFFDDSDPDNIIDRRLVNMAFEGGSVATDINDAGIITGRIIGLDRIIKAVLFSVPAEIPGENGEPPPEIIAQVLDLGTLGGFLGTANSINQQGIVVGNAHIDCSASPISHAFVYAGNNSITGNNTGLIDLNDLIDPDSGWELTQAQGINDNNVIVGLGLINGEAHAFMAEPLPNTTLPVNDNPLDSGQNCISLDDDGGDDDGDSSGGGGSLVPWLLWLGLGLRALRLVLIGRKQVR